MKTNRKYASIRQRIAQEAARILAEPGHQDYRLACRKAAARLGIGDARYFPKQAEIDQALREYQRLFRGARQNRELQRLRRLALEAMQSLHRFQPRLVGPVLQGTADGHSGITLHVFADAPEEVMLALSELNIPWHDGENSLRYRNGTVRRHPVFRFEAGDSAVELVVFAPLGMRDAPLNQIDDQPEARANITEVRALLAT